MTLGACATTDDASVRADAEPASAAQVVPATQPPAPAQIAGFTWKQGLSCTCEYSHNGTKAVRTETATSVDGNRVVLNLSGDGVNVDMISGTGTLSYWIAPEVNCPVKLEYRNSFGEKGQRVLRSAGMR